MILNDKNKSIDMMWIEIRITIVSFYINDELVKTNLLHTMKINFVKY